VAKSPFAWTGMSLREAAPDLKDSSGTKLKRRAPESPKICLCRICS
jgi:hypothetical protein